MGEHSCLDRQLSCSDVEPLKLSDLLGRASADKLDAWAQLSFAYPDDSRGDESLRLQIASYYNRSGGGGAVATHVAGSVKLQPAVSSDDVTITVPAEGILLAMLAIIEEGYAVSTLTLRTRLPPPQSVKSARTSVLWCVFSCFADVPVRADFTD